LLLKKNVNFMLSSLIRILAVMLAVFAVFTSSHLPASAQELPKGWSEVSAIGAKKYEFPGSATVLATRKIDKSATLEQFFKMAQRQTSQTAGCPLLESAIAESIFDGAAMFAFSQEGVGRCFVLVGTRSGQFFTKVAIERNGGNTNVEAFAKQLLAADLGFRVTQIASAPIMSKAPVDSSAATVTPQGGATGFPADYNTTEKCVTFDEIAQFQKIFFAGNIAPETRAMLVNSVSKTGSMQIVSNASAADFLVEVAPEKNGTRLSLWAVASRPVAGKPGSRCNVMPVTKPTAQQAIDELSQYLTVLAGSKRGVGKVGDSASRMAQTGFPDYLNGPYKHKNLCYKRIANEEILQFKNVYVAADTPPDLRSMITSAITSTGRFNVVDDSLKANYLIALTRDLNSSTETFKEPDKIVVGEWSETLVRGKTIKEKTDFETVGLSIMGVRHPNNAAEVGMVCGIYRVAASKVRGLSGWAMRDPGKTMTAELVKFLNKPDLTYSDYPTAVLEALAK
jgi:hypothetical protein